MRKLTYFSNLGFVPTDEKFLGYVTSSEFKKMTPGVTISEMTSGAVCVEVDVERQMEWLCLNDNTPAATLMDLLGILTKGYGLGAAFRT